MTRALPHIAAMAAYALSDPTPPQAIALNQNESVWPPSPRALAAGAQAIASATRYPDPQWTELRAAIADVHDLRTGDILCGAGSMELIGALIRAYCGPETEIVGSQYGYLFVATAAQHVNARYVAAPETAFTVDPMAILAAVTPTTKMVFLCNPANPTGTKIDSAAVRMLRSSLRADVLLVLDEAYGEFEDGNAPLFDLALTTQTVVLRTFSKAYGLAGARVGWAVAPPTVAGEMRKVLNPNNVTTAAQAMAAAAMRDQDYMYRTVAKTVHLRDAFLADVRALGIAAPQSHTNFVLMPMESAAAARGLNRILVENGVLLRAMDGYGLPQCLRATVGTEDDMGRLLGILKKELS